MCPTSSPWVSEDDVCHIIHEYAHFNITFIVCVKLDFTRYNLRSNCILARRKVTVKKYLWLICLFPEITFDISQVSNLFARFWLKFNTAMFSNCHPYLMIELKEQRKYFRWWEFSQVWLFKLQMLCCVSVKLICFWTIIKLKQKGFNKMQEMCDVCSSKSTLTVATTKEIFKKFSKYIS